LLSSACGYLSESEKIFFSKRPFRHLRHRFVSDWLPLPAAIYLEWAKSVKVLQKH
jgi:hypothetical protein